MGVGALLSALLHGAVAFLCFSGFANFLHRDLEPPPIIPIDIINIAEITQAPASAVKPKDDAPEKEVEKEKPVPPKPTPEKEPDPQPEEKTEPEPEEKPEPKPEEKPEPKPEPKEEKKAEPDVTMDDLLAKIPEEKPKKKVEEKKKDKPKPKKKKKKDFMALLNNIEKAESSSKGKSQQEQDENSTADHAASTIGDVLSVSELDLIRRQFRECWNVPAAARDAKDLYVDIKIDMNPDATVRSAIVVGTGGDGAFAKVAADSALRAVRHPNCNPLKLPLARYDQWKTIVIRFDPQHIL